MINLTLGHPGLSSQLLELSLHSVLGEGEPGGDLAQL